MKLAFFHSYRPDESKFILYVVAARLCLLLSRLQYIYCITYITYNLILITCSLHP